ncbi:MAG TPA: outer membrane lipoprotein carrier protein LolA [Bacillota bacterium]|nr:outer membrane lipoprotein carrier protein LolA [Bacillota bacterium]
MLKKFTLSTLVVFGLVLLLSACGEKSQEDVVKKLDKKLEEMKGYKVKAEMKMNTGQEDQTYNIDVWHKKKDFYRVALSHNKDEKSSQMILKNEDGVYVLTPSLNKSFKFQTEWPDNSSQPYLFQSLVEDIQKDPEAKFEANESHYIFHTKTNYQSNNNLPYQEIHIDKKSYTPTLVKVMDVDNKSLVEVEFSQFDMDPSFKDKDFVLEENMKTNSELADVTASSDVTDDVFTFLFPDYTAGAELAEKKEVDIDDGERMILTYAGDKNFTLVEEKRDTIPTLSSPQEVEGDIVNLGHTIGVLTNNSIEWFYQGVNYYLASDELTKDELINIAQSVTAKEVK